MSHLSEAQLDELREALAAELRRLERSMAVTDEALEPVKLDQMAVGRLSRIDTLQNQGLTKNLREREKVKLSRLERAFRRMEEGSYGTCVECGAEIAFGRLSVFPEAPTCGPCGAGG